jgi:hypothetical protein
LKEEVKQAEDSAADHSRRCQVAETSENANEEAWQAKYDKDVGELRVQNATLLAQNATLLAKVSSLQAALKKEPVDLTWSDNDDEASGASGALGEGDVTETDDDDAAADSAAADSAAAGSAADGGAADGGAAGSKRRRAAGGAADMQPSNVGAKLRNKEDFPAYGPGVKKPCSALVWSYGTEHMQCFGCLALLPRTTRRFQRCVTPGCKKRRDEIQEPWNNAAAEKKAERLGGDPSKAEQDYEKCERCGKLEKGDSTHAVKQSKTNCSCCRGYEPTGKGGVGLGAAAKKCDNPHCNNRVQHEKCLTQAAVEAAIADMMQND